VSFFKPKRMPVQIKQKTTITYLRMRGLFTQKGSDRGKPESVYIFKGTRVQVK